MRLVFQLKELDLKEHIWDGGLFIMMISKTEDFLSVPDALLLHHSQQLGTSRVRGNENIKNNSNMKLINITFIFSNLFLQFETVQCGGVY